MIWEVILLAAMPILLFISWWAGAFYRQKKIESELQRLITEALVAALIPEENDEDNQ